jgi:Ni,Fe-hydrogenase I small subunit
MGSCAAYGGIPKANPNPTGAVSVSDIIKDKPIINIPGCPPIPVVMTGVLAHFLTFGSLPELDARGVRKRSTAKPSMIAAIAARSTIRASSPRPSTTRARATAGVCSNSAARGR